jgi:hypothetical protein
MKGPSTTDASQGWLGWSNAVGELRRAMAIPDAERGWAQIVAGWPDPPFDFQVR